MDHFHQTQRQKRNASASPPATSTRPAPLLAPVPLPAPGLPATQARWSFGQLALTRDELEGVHRDATVEPGTQRSSPVIQRKAAEAALVNRNNTGQPVQLAEATYANRNNTGLPDHLKTGVERLSGLSLDDVRVHYNSSRPDQVDALAYTRGRDIYMGSGQERHLAHEAWHVVQQKQGRVEANWQAREGAVNDDDGLEHEADIMGKTVSQTDHGITQKKEIAVGTGQTLLNTSSSGGERNRGGSGTAGVPVIQMTAKPGLRKRTRVRVHTEGGSIGEIFKEDEIKGGYYVEIGNMQAFYYYDDLDEVGESRQSGKPSQSSRYYRRSRSRSRSRERSSRKSRRSRSRSRSRERSPYYSGSREQKSTYSSSGDYGKSSKEYPSTYSRSDDYSKSSKEYPSTYSRSGDYSRSSKEYPERGRSRERSPEERSEKRLKQEITTTTTTSGKSENKGKPGEKTRVSLAEYREFVQAAAKAPSAIGYVNEWLKTHETNVTQGDIFQDVLKEKERLAKQKQMKEEEEDVGGEKKVKDLNDDLLENLFASSEEKKKNPPLAPEKKAEKKKNRPIKATRMPAPKPSFRSSNIDPQKGNQECVLAAFATVKGNKGVIEPYVNTLTSTDQGIAKVANGLMMATTDIDGLKADLAKGMNAFIQAPALSGGGYHAYCAFAYDDEEDLVYAWDPDNNHHDVKAIPPEKITLIYRQL